MYVSRSIPINKNGIKLSTFINSLDVENKWKRNNYIDWYSGETINIVNKLNSFYSHCSSFVASVCKRLNIPIYGPEFNVPTEGLANKQYQWLFEYGEIYGWKHINNQNQLENEIFAQLMANNGYIVIVCHYHLINKNKGHIGVIKPYEIGIHDIIKYGCIIAQSGKRNSSNMYLVDGFRNKRNDCKYFYNKNKINILYF
jgi:hypothetical protein